MAIPPGKPFGRDAASVHFPFWRVNTPAWPAAAPKDCTASVLPLLLMANPLFAKMSLHRLFEHVTVPSWTHPVAAAWSW